MNGTDRRSASIRSRAHLALLRLGLAAAALPMASAATNPTPLERVEGVINATKPLRFPRGDRLPLVVWPLQGLKAGSDAELESALRRLDERGLATVAAWRYRDKEASLALALQLAAMQQKLGLEVVVNATGAMEQFFNGDDNTAHIGLDGKPFFDLSFSPKAKIGCPFAVAHRYPAIAAQVEYFVRAYAERGLPLDLVIGDWEIDGPSEWNDAWNASRRCQRCRKEIGRIDDFGEFQRRLREIRCDMQKATYADPIRRRFPRVRVGNYGVYPNDGYRYWYDFYEREPDIQPHRTDQRAKYRPWFQEFPLTGYTFAMPVAYTWYPIFNWYDWQSSDYRWFYNLLNVVTCAGRSTAPDIPIITFVHWHTTSPPPQADPAVKQFSPDKYQELLWHAFLRGHDGLALWCRASELETEVRLAQEVYAAALEYKEFLDAGKPLTFDVPAGPGPVVSALQLGNRLLVRRTDFDADSRPVELVIRSRRIAVPRAVGCQIIVLDP